MKKQLVILSIALLFLLAAIEAANALPINASVVNRGLSERSTGPGAPTTEPSEGGNTTSLSITANTVSARWQGYYGNVTGNVTLGDAQNNVLYSWIDLSPAGEVYAANKTSVNWPNIFCVNMTDAPSTENIHRDQMNTFIGYTSDNDRANDDTVNKTFNQTFGDDGSTLAVGARTIVNADNCSMVTLNTGTGYQTASFKEVILTDNETVVFASILENNANGFKNHATDFEMIVGVNQTNLRNYFFFVELS